MSNLSSRNLSRSTAKKKLFILGYNMPPSLRHLERRDEFSPRAIERRGCSAGPPLPTIGFGIKLLINAQTVLPASPGDEAVDQDSSAIPINRNSLSHFNKYKPAQAGNSSSNSHNNSSLRVININMDSSQCRSTAASKLNASGNWSEVEELNDSLKQEFIKERNKSKWANC